MTTYEEYEMKNNQFFMLFSDDDENYEIEEGKLSISDIDESLLGIYSCQSLEGEGTVLRRFQLDTSLKINKFPKSISVNDGLPQELLCTLNSHVRTILLNTERTNLTKLSGRPRSCLQLVPS